MKLIRFATLAMLLVAGGCGQKEAEPSKVMPPKKAAPAPGPSVMPSLDKSAAPPPPPAASAAASATVTKPGASDEVAFYRPKDNLGNVATDLQVLNSALMAYGTDGTQRPPFHDLSDLVKAGLLKKLPTAPPGKKYVFDPKTGQAKLENQ